ncbi:MAG: hypothetical protein ACM3UZ_15295 [Acidobacteriota bacterium]
MIVLKALLLIVGLSMIVMIILSPGRIRDNRKEVVIDAARHGSRFEFAFRRTMLELNPEARLTIEDDGRDHLRADIIARLLIRNPGISLRRIGKS